MTNDAQDELSQTKDPHRDEDRKLIHRCIGGLIAYAAWIAQNNQDSPTIEDVRDQIDTLAGYWNLDNFNLDVLEKNYLLPFDFFTELGKSDAALGENINQYIEPIVGGLLRYCEELTCTQGVDAENEILSIKDFAYQVLSVYDFESLKQDNLIHSQKLSILT